MKKMNRFLALSFVLAVGLALTVSGTASAATLALWDYNGNFTASGSQAWQTSTANNPVSSNSSEVGLTGTQNHVISMRWGYNDGTFPASGSGDWTVDTKSGTADDRYRFEVAGQSSGAAKGGLIWNVNTAGYTDLGISLGLFTSTPLGNTGYINSFLLGYSPTGADGSWTDTTFTYAGNTIWTPTSGTGAFVLTGIPSGNNYFHLLLNGNPSSAEVLTVDLVKITGNAVPIPAAAWLLGSGLVGLVVIKRKKKK